MGKAQSAPARPLGGWKRSSYSPCRDTPRAGKVSLWTLHPSLLAPCAPLGFPALRSLAVGRPLHGGGPQPQSPKTGTSESLVMASLPASRGTLCDDTSAPWPLPAAGRGAANGSPGLSRTACACPEQVPVTPSGSSGSTPGTPTSSKPICRTPGPGLPQAPPGTDVCRGLPPGSSPGPWGTQWRLVERTLGIVPTLTCRRVGRVAGHRKLWQEPGTRTPTRKCAAPQASTGERAGRGEVRQAVVCAPVGPSIPSSRGRCTADHRPGWMSPGPRLQHSEAGWGTRWRPVEEKPPRDTQERGLPPHGWSLGEKPSLLFPWCTHILGPQCPLPGMPPTYRASPAHRAAWGFQRRRGPLSSSTPRCPRRAWGLQGAGTARSLPNSPGTPSLQEQTQRLRLLVQASNPTLSDTSSSHLIHPTLGRRETEAWQETRLTQASVRLGPSCPFLHSPPTPLQFPTPRPGPDIGSQVPGLKGAEGSPSAPPRVETVPGLC